MDRSSRSPASNTHSAHATSDESSQEGPRARSGGSKSSLADFQFINLNPTNLGRDKKTQTVVRKHVMRGYRRQLATRSQVPKESKDYNLGATSVRRSVKIKRGRHASESSSTTSSCSPTSLSTLPSTSLFEASPFSLFKSFFCQNCAKLLPYSRPLPTQTQHLAHEICSCPNPTPFTTEGPDKRQQEVSTALILGSWRTDPFDALPIETKHKVPVLINHYRDVIQGSNLNSKYLSVWQQFMYSDPAVLHATLFYSANHAQILAGLANNVDVFFHRGETIRLLNERLENPEDRISDGTIAAVASLALFEDMFGSAEAAASHRTGLYQLVAMRGGLKRLGLHGVIERLVLWAGDVYKSPKEVAKKAKMEEQPIISPIDPENLPGVLKQMAQERPVELKEPADLRPLIMEIFSRLRNCFMLISKLPNGPRKTTISFPPKFRIMSLLNERDLDDPNPVTELNNSNSWLIASLLYVHVVLYDGYDAKAYDEEVQETVDDLVEKLQAALRKEQPLLAQKKYPPRVLVWLLLVGGVNAREQAQLTIFQPLIVRVSNALGLTHWQAARQYISDLPQFQPQMNAGCRALWCRAVGGSPVMTTSSASSSPKTE